MTYANFKDQVVGYLNRTAASVVTTGAQDLVLAAMNDARRWAQRQYTFEMNATQSFVQLSMLGKSLLADFRTAPAGSTVVVVKRIDSIHEYSTETIASTTVYYPTKRIEYRRRQALYSHLPSDPSSTALGNPTVNEFAYLHGVKLYHTNLTTQTWVMADVIEQLADHDGGSGTDIFLNYFTDWLKFATLANLNVWLKDSERTVIDQALLAGMWESVKQFDAQQAISTDDLSLD